MAPGDRCPAGGRPEVAGWVLGALEPGEAIRFGEHLLVCAACRQAAAEFEPVSRMLGRAAAAPEPSPALRARTLAAVEQAAGAAGEDRRRTQRDAR